ncbi:MAG: hypothetical protein WCW78_01525 [Candidatus Paceibacterota bacterium]|jgi:hypothetical protein
MNGNKPSSLFAFFSKNFRRGIAPWLGITLVVILWKFAMIPLGLITTSQLFQIALVPFAIFLTGFVVSLVSSLKNGKILKRFIEKKIPKDFITKKVVRWRSGNFFVKGLLNKPNPDGKTAEIIWIKAGVLNFIWEYIDVPLEDIEEIKETNAATFIMRLVTFGLAKNG